MKKVKLHDKSFSYGENIYVTIFMLLASGLLIFFGNKHCELEIVQIFIWGYFSTIYYSNYYKFKNIYYLFVALITTLPVAYSIYIYFFA